MCECEGQTAAGAEGTARAEEGGGKAEGSDDGDRAIEADKVLRRGGEAQIGGTEEGTRGDRRSDTGAGAEETAREGGAGNGGTADSAGNRGLVEGRGGQRDKEEDRAEEAVGPDFGRERGRDSDKAAEGLNGVGRGGEDSEIQPREGAEGGRVSGRTKAHKGGKGERSAASPRTAGKGLR